ncbi:MAG: hypothetical protein ACRCSL_08450 [Microbacterium sp.]
MSASATLKAAKAALLSVCTSLYPTADGVVYGPADDYDGPELLVEIRDASWSEREGEGRQSPQRRRWYDFSIDLVVVVSSGGGEEVQQNVTEAAMDAIGLLEDYLQDSGVVGSQQTSLGGVVEWARVTDSEFTDEDDDIERGRTTTATATVSGRFLA